MFVKANPALEEARQEVLGHQRIRDHYPVPELLRARKFAKWAVVVYRLWPDVCLDRGLLLDEIAHADRARNIHRLDTCIDEIICRYRTVIARTIRRAAQLDTITKLYGNRAAPGGRLDTYYRARSPWTALTGDSATTQELHLIVNNQPHVLDFHAIRTTLNEHFQSRKQVWAAVTQGDPTDFNIGWSPDAGPIWFDYDTGGLSALAGEFACFLLYQRLHGAWLTPTYNPEAFVDHPTALKTATQSKPTVHIARHQPHVMAIDYMHRPTFARQHLLCRYVSELVRPTAAHLGIRDLMGWLRPYLVMRLLAVYNLTRLHPHDAALSLGLLAEALEADTTLDDLLAISTRNVVSPT